MILESIKMVFKVFKTNKLRTFLTMIGLIIGIFSVTIIFTLSDSVKNMLSEELEIYDSEIVYINFSPNNYTQKESIESELEEYLSTNKKIKSYTRINSFYYYDTTNTISIDGLGIDENYYNVNTTSEKPKMLYGRFLEKKDIINKMPYIVISSDFAKKIVGTIKAVNKQVVINGYEMKVIGVYENKDDTLLYTSMIASYYFTNDYFTDDTSYSYISNNKKESIKEIKNILNSYFDADSYNVQSFNLEDYKESFTNIIDIISLIFAAIAGLSILVGGIGIMNIMLVSVSERIKETGIRMALGAKNKYIVFQFLIESIMLTILSGIIGILLAYGLVFIANNVFSETEYDIEFVINIITLIKIILFSGLLGVVFGIYPAKKAGKLDPVEALKYE